MLTDKRLRDTSFFKNKQGQIVIWQWPNTAIYGWLVFLLLSNIFNKGIAHNGFSLLSKVSIFTWAYLEVTQGASYFRRLLGLIITVLLVFSYFR